MKHKKINFIALIAILLLVGVFLTGIIFTSTKKITEREKYETFLSNQFKEIPNLSDKELSKIPKPGQPDMAAYQDFLQTIDPELGYIPPKRLTKAYKEIQTMENKSKEDLTWQGTSSDMGGRIRNIKFDPNDLSNNKLWAGSVTGGLWYNNDITEATSSWIPVDDFWEKLSVSAIAFDPNNTQIMYVGSGEAETAVVTYRESSGLGVGIWKSTDAGDTWEIITSTEDFVYVTDVVVRDEAGTSVIYAGVVSGFYQGQNQQSLPNDGLYRSDDGGESWKQVLPNITGEDVPYSPSDIEITADGRIFVGTMPNLNEQGGATILYSDEGTSDNWTIYEDYVSIIQSNYYNILGRVKLSAAPSNQNVVYAAIGSGSDNQTIQTFRQYICEYILKTDDKGSTWSEINIPSSDWAYLSWHALILKVDPNDEDILWAGGLDVWRTQNAGTSWSHLSDWAGMYDPYEYYVHADQHDMAFRAGNSSELFFATDGGVFYTNEATIATPAFEERSKDFNTLQFYTCDIIPDEGVEFYFGGLQDNGSLKYDGSPFTPYSMISGGDGAYCFIDENETIGISSTYNNNYSIFVNYSYYNYFSGSTGTFVSPAEYDSRINMLYANAVSFDGYNLNEILVVDIPDVNNPYFITVGSGFDVPFSHLRMSPHSPDNYTNLYAGTMSGRLFRIECANYIPSVSEITGSNFPAASISSIDFGETENTIFVSFSNFGVESVWMSIDGGSTWESKQGNLPDLPVRWLIAHPENENQIMLATEIGVWTTLDITADEVEWTIQNNGLGNVRVDMLQMRKIDNTILAASHGRGLFTTTWNVEIPSQNNENISQNEISIFPNPSNGIINIENPENMNYDKIQIIAINGKIVYETKTIDKKHTINLSNCEKGVYFVNFYSKNQIFTKRIVLF